MLARINCKCQDTARGFSLLEVLIALVVLSIGLLGVAGLQIGGLRYVHNANLRYQASLQANDMIDRMRANRAGVAAGAYNNISGTPLDPGCISTGCSPATMAVTDAFQWNTDNAALLPGGAGTVVGNGINNVFTITITWNERGGQGEASQARTFVVNALI